MDGAIGLLHVRRRYGDTLGALKRCPTVLPAFAPGRFGIFCSPSVMRLAEDDLTIHMIINLTDSHSFALEDNGRGTIGVTSRCWLRNGSDFPDRLARGLPRSGRGTVPTPERGYENEEPDDEGADRGSSLARSIRLAAEISLEKKRLELAARDTTGWSGRRTEARSGSRV